METFAQIGENESRFDEVYRNMLPKARKKLVEITLQSYGAIKNTNVDYKQIAKILFEIEKRGGRQASEPRTIAGETLIIATLLAISLHSQEDLYSDTIKKYIEEISWISTKN